MTTADQLEAAYEEGIYAGIQLQCVSNPALNGNYKIDPNHTADIAGIYAGIKGGDGLPGGGSTFNYIDADNNVHAFNADEFVAFAKGVRDYKYALSFGAAANNIVSIP